MIKEVEVKYVDFDGKEQKGAIVCNEIVSDELIDIFNKIFDLKFPIYSIIPISEFNNEDLESVKANNTSCYCYRQVIGSEKLSDHAKGLAVDINPMQNPWMHPSAHKIEGRGYNIGAKGTITNDVVYI